MARRPLSHHHVSSWFRSNGFRLLTEYRHSKQGLRFRCRCGTIRNATWNNLFNRKYGIRCRQCVANERARDPRTAERRVQVHLRSIYRNVSEMARLCGLPDATLRVMIADGSVPAPSTRIPGKPRLYYSPREADRLLKLAFAFRGDK